VEKYAHCAARAHFVANVRQQPTLDVLVPIGAIVFRGAWDGTVECSAILAALD